MNALVIGSNGYIGRHIALAAREAGWSVTPSDIHDRAWDGDRQYVRCDLRDRRDLSNLDWDVDAVLFFAGLSGTTVGWERYDEFIDGNEKALIGALESIRCTGSSFTKFVFPSSRLVYHGIKDIPLAENAALDCRTIYAATKRAGELYVDMYRRLFGLRTTVFRICVPYGNRFDHTYSYGTVGHFLRHALLGHDIPVYGDGAQRRTFSHIDDVCRQILAASSRQESDGLTLNVGGADDLSIAEAASLVASRFGVGVTTTEWPKMDLLCESGDTIFDSRAIFRLTGYRCCHTYRNWVKDLPVQSLGGAAGEGRAP